MDKASNGRVVIDLTTVESSDSDDAPPVVLAANQEQTPIYTKVITEAACVRAITEMSPDMPVERALEMVQTEAQKGPLTIELCDDIVGRFLGTDVRVMAEKDPRCIRKRKRDGNDDIEPELLGRPDTPSTTYINNA
jgi:hypothetical protein